jgi:hypothetical protein
MFNLNSKVDQSNENTTEERKDTVDFIESAFQSATKENTQAVTEALEDPTDRPFRLLINADWDFGADDAAGEVDLKMLRESSRMLIERIEAGQQVEIVTAGYRKGSANMIEHFAAGAANSHENVTHREVEPIEYQTLNRNRFLARYADAALLFKASEDEFRMSQHMHTSFQEWKPATRNGQPKRVVVVTREQLS